MEITRVDSKCLIENEKTHKIVEAEVHEFKERERLVAVVNRSVKVSMVWNGKFYEGKMAGMDFISDGPKVTKTQTGR
jgi:hypothetical protein